VSTRGKSGPSGVSCVGQECLRVVGLWFGNFGRREASSWAGGTASGFNPESAPWSFLPMQSNNPTTLQEPRFPRWGACSSQCFLPLLPRFAALFPPSCTLASPIRALAATTAPPVCVFTTCHIRANLSWQRASASLIGQVSLARMPASHTAVDWPCFPVSVDGWGGLGGADEAIPAYHARQRRLACNIYRGQGAAGGMPTHHCRRASPLLRPWRAGRSCSQIRQPSFEPLIDGSMGMDNAKCCFAINHAAMNPRVPPCSGAVAMIEDRPALLLKEAAWERHETSRDLPATGRLSCRCHASATAQSRLYVQQKPGVLPLPPRLAVWVGRERRMRGMTSQCG
jgi:hypothetical protein